MRNVSDDMGRRRGIAVGGIMNMNVSSPKQNEPNAKPSISITKVLANLVFICRMLRAFTHATT